MLRRVFLASSAMMLASACTPGVFGRERGTARPVMRRSYDIRNLSFAAAPDIRVSEAEGYYPQADVVWRGDPLGPRIPQIESMFQEAFNRNKPKLAGDRPVNVRITLVRFHGVTDLTRLTVGGNYNIIFDMTVIDARTGAVLEPARRIVGNLSAPGGSRGRALIASGQTQRVRVTDFLSGLLLQQLV
ncbi:MAG: DUF6778 family protein [Yoonia sp.]|uniref:DUF6778 family protein n=1 Tax=Yoonia sp. TaxID=2212373 RepID=UPI003EF75223